MQYFGISLNIKKIKNVTLFHFIKPHMLVKYYVSKKKPLRISKWLSFVLRYLNHQLFNSFNDAFRNSNI